MVDEADERFLEQAEAAWADGRSEDALSAAVSAWQIAPVPAIAAVVRAASAKVAPPVAKPPRSKDEFQAAWMRVAAEDGGVAATGWLAEHLVHLVPEVDDRFGMLRPDWMGEKYHALFVRLEALRPRCPDPRIGDAALGILRDGKYGFWDLPSVERVYRPVLDLLVAAGDPSLAAAVREVAAVPRSKRATVRQWCQEQLPDAADRLEAVTGTLPAALVARWQALAPHSSAAARTVVDLEGLLSAVLARPTDAAARHVLADALLEAEDPRGQLLSLQLGGAGPDDARVRKLLRSHQRAWLGDALDATLTGVVFRGGFPEEAGLRANAAAELAVWEAAAQDPRLATFRTLRKGQGNRDHYLRFVTSEQMRDLRRVELPTKALLDALGDGPIRPLETLLLGFGPKRAVLKKIAQAPGFATVTGLLLEPTFDLHEVLADLRAVGLADRLVGFGIATEGYRDGAQLLPALGELHTALPGLQWVQLVGSVLRREGEGWVLEILVQGQDAMYLNDGEQHGVAWMRHEGPEIQLQDLPPEVVRVRAAGLSERLAAAVSARWGVPVDRT